MSTSSLVVLLLLVVATCAPTASSLDCISTYQDLKTAVINNLNNTQSLLVGFYPPNQSPAHVVDVFYNIESSGAPLDASDDNETMFPNFEQPNTTADYIFRWVDSSTLLLIEINLFQALGFNIAQLTVSNVTLVLPAFCEEDEALSLLNTLTVWLKSYAVGTEETSRYYSLYFNDEEFVTLNGLSSDSTSALVACEYAASIGWLIIIYTFLFLSRYKAILGKIIQFLSQVSPLCIAVVVTIVIYDINSYANQFQYSTSDWMRAFPVPIVFVVFSVVNLPLSIAVVVTTGENFPLPGLLQLWFHMCGSKCARVKKFVSCVLKVILIFSVTSAAILGVLHVAWVLLTFSAFPVRSMASQAFIVPFVAVIFIVFVLMDYVASSQSLIRQARGNTTSLFLIFAIILMFAPLTITLLGVLYYYSEALVEIDDSENNPLKTIIAGVIPALCAAAFLWLARSAIKGIEDVATEESLKENAKHNEADVSLVKDTPSQLQSGSDDRIEFVEEKSAGGASPA